MSVQTNLDLGAYRQAMLSVAPDRLEQFSLTMKQNINENKGKKKKKKDKSKHHKTETSSTTKSSSSKKDAKKKRSSKRKSSDTIIIKKKRKSSSDEDSIVGGDSDVEEGGLDLTQPLYPLSHFIKDREKLMNEVFRVVRGAKLEAMLPDKLKTSFNSNNDELRRRCLAHLEVMSSKRLLHVINGEKMDSSSGTDSSEDEVEKVEEKHVLQTNVIDSTTPSDGLLPTGKTAARGDLHNKSVDEEVEEEEVEYFEDEDYAAMVDTMLEESLPDTKEDPPKTPSTPPKTPPEEEPLVEVDVGSSRNQLEYLEQQLRLRAIKSLMKKTGGKPPPLKHPDSSTTTTTN